jgi:hypothetical protein
MRIIFIIPLFLLSLSCTKVFPEPYDPFEDPRNISRNIGCSSTSNAALDPTRDLSYVIWLDMEERADWEFKLFYRERRNGIWSKIDTLFHKTDSVWYDASKIVCDSKGILHLVYTEEGKILYRMRINDEWTEPETLSNPNEIALIPQLCIDKNDNLYLIFEESPKGATFRKREGGVWSEKSYPPQRGDFDMFVEDNGNIHLAMDTDDQITYVFSRDGVNWKDEIILLNDTIYYNLCSTVGVCFGKVYVVWVRSYGGFIRGLYMRVKDTLTGKWSDIERLEIAGGTGRAPYLPKFVKGDDGYLYLGWIERVGANDEVLISRMVNDRVWDKVVNISNTPMHSKFYSFIVKDGIIHIAWWEGIDDSRWKDEWDIFYDEIQY